MIYDNDVDGLRTRERPEYIHENAMERRKKLFVTYGDFGEQIHRPAVKLSR